MKDNINWIGFDPLECWVCHRRFRTYGGCCIHISRKHPEMWNRFDKKPLD